MSAERRVLHSRAVLDEGLEQLRHDLRRMASLVDVAIETSLASLANLDASAAEAVIDGDQRVNQLRFDIEEHAVRLIATQQPIAGDLRFIIATLSIVSELERMGDYCVGIGKIVLLHEGRSLLKPLVDIPRMGTTIREMLRTAIDAFISKNALAAEKTAQRDDEIDLLYDQIYRELLTYMLSDPTTMDRATWLLWVAHNLERMGDRIQNICERTVYEVTGVMKEFSGARAER